MNSCPHRTLGELLETRKIIKSLLRTVLPRRLLEALRTVAGRSNYAPVDLGSFTAASHEVKAGPDAGPIELAYFRHQGNLIHKWHHYLPLYDRYFAPLIARADNKTIRFLEIGVSHGGSLQLWREKFGKKAVIFGIDINPKCAKFDGERGIQIRIGSQADPNFLTKVVAEMGGVDIILDDGSHHAAHMRKSFDVLYPLLADGGIYVIEDLHCSYWYGFGGGYSRKGTMMSLVKILADDMHHWWHKQGQKIASARNHVTGIHIHDSFVVFEKHAAERPVHSQVGQSSL